MFMENTARFAHVYKSINAVLDIRIECVGRLFETHKYKALKVAEKFLFFCNSITPLLLCVKQLLLFTMTKIQ